MSTRLLLQQYTGTKSLISRFQIVSVPQQKGVDFKMPQKLHFVTQPDTQI